MTRKKTHKGLRRRPRGVLAVIAGLLIAAGLLRLVGPAGEVWATGVETEEPQAAATLGLCPDDVETAALLEAFRIREERLALRDARISDRMQALQVAEADIAAKLAALQEAEEALRATMATASTASDDDVGRLVAVYENMKPKDAAALFQEMDPAFSAGFLGRMRSDAAAAILSGIEPATAYSISVILAGRNAGVPTE
jgi:flagellar motility protein MotE (MotC chaperone)